MVTPTVERNIALDHEAIADFCRRWHIQRLSLFGSVLTDKFHDSSDIDLIVDFEPGHTPGFAFVQLAEELEGIFGRKVDLLTRRGLGKFIKERALSQAQTLYAAD